MKVRHVDWYADEWITGTIDLKLDERGMFITACCLIYSRGGPVLPGMLRSVCHEDLRTYNRCLKRLLDLGKLDLKDGYLSNKRCLSELQRAANRSLTGEQNVSKRWGKVNENKPATPEAVLPRSNANYQLTNYQLEDKKESSLTGAKESRPLTGAVRTKRRVPGDWQPDESGVAYALNKAGWVGVRLAEEVEHFRNRSERDGKLYFSVDAAWRTCVQLGHKFDLERNQRNGTKQSPGEKLFEGAFRAAERWEREHPADFEPGGSVIVPLLDSRRRSGDA